MYRQHTHEHKLSVCVYLKYFYGLHFACSCDFLLRPTHLHTHTHKPSKGPPKTRKPSKWQAATTNTQQQQWWLQNYILCMAISQRRHRRLRQQQQRLSRGRGCQGDEMAEKREITTRVPKAPLSQWTHTHIHMHIQTSLYTCT